MGQHLPQKVSNISREQEGGVPFHDFAKGYDGLVTEGEKSAAERGAAARQTYGAKRDRCNRGKSCGAACIFYQKDCVLELPVNVQNAIRGARRLIFEKMSRGEIGAQEAEQLFLQKTNLNKIDPNKSLGKRAKDVVWEQKGDRIVRAKGAAQGPAAEGLQDLKKAVKPSTGSADGDLEQRYLDVKTALKGNKDLGIKGLREEIPDAKERSAKIKSLFDLALEKGYGTYGDKGGYRPKRPEEMTEEFAKGVLNNQSFISKINSISANFTAGRISTAEYNREMNKAMDFMFTKSHSDAEVLMMSAFLSPGARAYLMTAGSTSAPNVYGSRFPGRDVVPVGQEVGGGKEVVRPWMMHNLRIMMDTDFREVYSRLPYKIHQVDMEHLTPEGQAKPLGGANIGGNKSFAFSKANQTRAEEPLSFFLSGTPGGLFGGGKLFNADGTYATAPSTKSSLKADLERQISSRATSVNNLIRVVNSVPPKDLKPPERAAMMAKIVTEYARESPTDKALSRSVTIGKQDKELRSDMSYHWFGGKAEGWSGARALGVRMAEALGRWQNEGDEGATKSIQLKGLIDRTSKNLLEIGAIEVNGKPIRAQQTTAPGVKEIREREFESRMASFMPEYDALLGP